MIKVNMSRSIDYRNSVEFYQDQILASEDLLAAANDAIARGDISTAGHYSRCSEAAKKAAEDMLFEPFIGDDDFTTDISQIITKVS